MELFYKPKESLGERTSRKILAPILPKGWQEVVYEQPEKIAIAVKRHESPNTGNLKELQDKFVWFLQELKDTFSYQIVVVDTSNEWGKYFIVYLNNKQGEKLTEQEEEGLKQYFQKYKDKLFNDKES